ncbi:MAG: molybdate ABC transporter substrate-binding protein [Trueperaceae bacterium]
MKLSRFVLTYSLLSILFIAYCQEIRVAAASDLQFALPEIIASFNDDYPNYTVSVSFGSSGNFYSQIQQGAPFDLYLSANADYTEKLETAGFTDADSRVLYAIGRIVLWVDDRLNVDVTTQQQNVLRNDAVQYIAIANPAHAPYGQAAVDFLKNVGLYEEIKDKFVYGENISQAAQLALDSAGVGIIALSLALNPTLEAAGSYWLIPLEDHLRLEQEMVILKGQARLEVKAFHAYMRSPNAHAVLERYGFILPD